MLQAYTFVPQCGGRQCRTGPETMRFSTHSWEAFMNQTFTVQGMTCGHCEKAVTKAIQRVDPQAEVKIDRTQNLVQVESTKAHEELSKAIAEEGYAVA
jgi:copper chaperone